MSSLVRYLGDAVPVGQMVFFRAAFAIVPVVLIYAMRGELMTGGVYRAPLGHVGRGIISVGGMFLNFAALARLPLVDATAISFASPLITVAFAAIFLRERVRIYRWSAVVLGLRRRHRHAVAVSRYLALRQSCDGRDRSRCDRRHLRRWLGAFTNAGSVIQTRRLTDTETTSSIVFYFSLFCALAGLATLPFGWIEPTADAACRADRHRPDRRAVAHLADRELSLRAGIAGRAVRLHDDDLGVRASAMSFRRGADCHGLHRRCHRRGAGLFVILRERQLGKREIDGRRPAEPD